MISKALTIIMLCFLITSSFVVICFNERCKAAGNEIFVDTASNYLYRDGTAEHPYKGIQEAIDKASEGDIIYVFGGTYNEILSINKKLTLVGSIENGPTIINYIEEDHKYAVEITADYVNFTGFNVTDSGNHIISYVKGALVHITSNNVIIQKNNITDCQNGWGIYLDSSDGNLIKNNFIDNTTAGIYFSSSSTNDLVNNTISNCSDAAVEMHTSNNNRLYSNSLSYNRYGAYVKDCIDINMTRNSVKNNMINGIGFYETSKDRIYYNTIQSNDVSGIYLNSLDSKVVGNIINSNSIGITLDGSSCEIRSNFINNSKSIGISANSGSKNNIVYLNHFYKNYISAKERGTNYWYDDGQGNYWDDYKEVDRDHDGIGDTYYTKNGVSDRYPLGNFLKPPSKPSDPSPKEGVANVSLKSTLGVKVYDPNGYMMDVYFYGRKAEESDFKLITKVSNTVSGSRAYCSLNLPFNTVFAWYVKVNNSKLENQSIIWFFTTRARPAQNEPPIADPGGPYAADSDQYVLFNASGSHDHDGKIEFYRWNFGDGTSEILDISPLHRYFNDGTYYVNLTVIDNYGTSSMATVEAIIGASENHRPTAKISGLSLVKGNAGDSMQFSGSESSDNDSGDRIVSYFWDFGDGTNGTGEYVTHTYSKSGTYKVTLDVTDTQGVLGSDSINVEISAPPKKSPGYEIILVITAVLLVFIWRRRR
ncbi:MAG: PKD domain-containing protein [Euryarchaeota archaeon]|nr:PKD domain-containing protein [Euryarchaeota archaeon]